MFTILFIIHNPFCLLGADIAGKLMTGKILNLTCGKNCIGDIAWLDTYGKAPSSSDSVSMTVTNLLIKDCNISDLWKLEDIGITDPAESKKKTEMHQDTLDYFRNTLTIDEEGRYEIAIPWVLESSRHPDNRQMAEKQLYSVYKKLVESEKVGVYAYVFKKWIAGRLSFLKIKDKKGNPSPELDAKILLSPRNSSTLLLTVLVKIINKDRSLIIRGLFDTGAQRSFIKKDIVDKLGLEPVDQEMLSHGLFGGSETKQKSHNVYNITLQSLCSNFRHNISVLDEKKICGAIPRVSNPDIFPILKRKNIELSDTGEDTPEIDLLIGADYLGVLLTGSIEHVDKNLVAIKTKLGWTLQGKQTKQSKSLENIIYVANLDLTELWSLDAIGIRDPVEIKSRQVADEEAVEFFRKTIKRNEDKRYEVCLPWKSGYPELESNKELATKRLMSTTKNLIREEAAKFISEAKELMSAAKFDLRGWVTSAEIVEETKKRYIPILGLSWDTENDELSCNSAIKISEENITKRTLLSVAQRIYDPIGFTSPTTLIPKIILQKTWKRKINWDDVLPPDICNEFLAWYKHVNLLKDCKIPRRLISNPFKDCQISLHCFSDANEASYAACIFLRAEYNGKVSVQLVASKSSVTNN
ncbi:hypothetical protein HNY73_001545 [Argiope bruennichi]|uniref:Peptidase aspartic putative domain-containing protein n=1 Tax=Argiope bruennichi TaxID=94029 RepID=A0A8T0G591_ARGBR|nr:hypothetical protein HNY73_001545 [Argiope bruennichi]